MCGPLQGSRAKSATPTGARSYSVAANAISPAHRFASMTLSSSRGGRSASFAPDVVVKYNALKVRLVLPPSSSKQASMQGMAAWGGDSMQHLPGTCQHPGSSHGPPPLRDSTHSSHISRGICRSAGTRHEAAAPHVARHFSVGPCTLKAIFRDGHMTPLHSAST
jgi:hypothetical protein